MRPNTGLRRAEIELGGERIGYWIRRTIRRRHVHLVIDEERGLEVRVPSRYARSGIEPLLRRHAAWILARLEDSRIRRRRRPPLVTGASLPYLGGSLRLDVVVGSRPRIERQGAALLLRHPTGDEEALPGIVEGWYRAEARTELTRRLRELGAALGDLHPSRVQIRGQRTRWGSCSSRGTISLNWRLMLLPRELVDYVLVHELCHLRHLDHSSRFWELVASVVPDYPQRRRRLHAHQEALPF